MKHSHSQLVSDVEACVEHIENARKAEGEERRALLFRAGLRLMRAEKGLETLSQAIDLLTTPILERRTRS